jgi:hypothetical protein
MVRRAFVVLCFGLMTILMAGCGQSYKLLSLTVTPGTPSASGNQLITLLGIGGFQQLTVTAAFSNGKTQDVTVDPHTTFQINASGMPAALNPAVAVPLTSISLSKSGKVTVLSEACTVDTEPVPGSGDTAWTYFGYPYKAQVSYTENGVTATTSLDIFVINSRYCWDGTDSVGGNGSSPFTGFAGNLVEGWGT